MVQENNINNKILIICGPTASGKTALAIECAKLLDTEIISADCMNVYRGLDVGTAKPTLTERAGIVHHLIDVVNPTEEFTVSDYKKQATEIVDKLQSSGKIPVVCGGTGFYINSILYDMSYGKTPCNLEVRDKYKKMAETEGNLAVYKVLQDYDPKSAEKLHYNDLVRVIRALEIYHSGIKKSEIIDELIPKYDYKSYSINFEREVLYSRINKRVDLMVEDELVDEVKSLLNQGVNKNNQSMQGIGYKEILEYFDGDITLDDAIEKIKLNTRHYAKRQITFFKRDSRLTLLPPDNVSILAKRIVEQLWLI